MARTKATKKAGRKKPVNDEDYEASDGGDESEKDPKPEDANVNAEAEDANVNANTAGGEDAGDANQVTSVEDEFYVEMFMKMGFREKAALELVLSEEINTRAKLERITSTRAYSICKAIRSPGGSSRGAHVTEGAQHNLLMIATVFNNSTRVSRPIGPLDSQAPPNDMFDLHESQLTMETR